MFDSSKYTIGWVCALRTELVAATVHLDEEHDSVEYEAAPNDNNTYVFGRIGKHNVVLATLPRNEYGTNSAAATARDMIRSFTNIRIGLMVGIGGGAPLVEPGKKIQDIRLGDVVVSTPGNGRGGVLQYDHGKTIQEQDFLITGHLNAPPTSILAVINVLGAEFERKGNGLDEDVAALLEVNRKMRKAYQRPEQSTDRLCKASFVHIDFNGSCSEECKRDENVESRDPREDDEDIVAVHDGLIASANTLMKDALIRNKLAREHGILCFEMEASGLMNQFPFLVVRGICDYADSHKNKDWQGYAAMTAAAYTKKLLLRLAPNKVATESKLSDIVEIKDSLKEIGTTINAVESTLQQYTAKTLREDVERWLAAPDPEVDYHLSLKLREPGTGSWLINSTAYTQWKTGSIKHLWLHGKAGCGKSIIAATIIEDVKRYCEELPNVGYGIFYFTFSDAGKQSYFDCLRSLIHQVRGRGPASAMLGKAYNASKQKQAASRFDDEESLQEVLISTIQTYDQFLLIIDGLDESPERTDGNYSIRQTLLDWLYTTLQSLPQTKLLATSRYLNDIQMTMEKLDARQESMITEFINIDIQKFVQRHLASDARLNRLDAATKQNIDDVFVKKSDGMFRWVYCQMIVLKELKLPTPKKVEQLLRSLPITLDETYYQVLSKIDQDSQRYVSNMLRWLAYSRRPLTVSELGEATNIEPHGSNKIIEPNERVNLADVLDLLSGLILVVDEVTVDTKVADSEEVSSRDSGSIDDDSLSDPSQPSNASDASLKQSQSTSECSSLAGIDQVVRLSHFSVQEYLESARILESGIMHFSLEGPGEEQSLSNSCCSYLTNYAKQQNAKYTKSDLKLFPFLGYAARFWYQHCQNAVDLSRQIEFLCCPAAVSCWLLVCQPESRFLEPFTLWHPSDYKGSALYYASLFGWLSAADALISQGANVDETGGIHGNSLSAASMKGHIDIVKTLIQARADVNSLPPFHLSTPLHKAAFAGHEEIVAMLIDAGANVNAGENSEWSTPLQLASYRGHKATVELLVKAGANVDAWARVYKTALYQASLMGHTNIVEFLIEAAVDTKSWKNSLSNALAIALSKDHKKITEILIKAGAMQTNTNNVEISPAPETLEKEAVPAQA